ncbi:MAG: TolC family protein, partial [Kofleriaceae bacterium]
RAAEARIASTRAELAAVQADAELGVRRRFVALQAAQQRTAALAGAVDDARTVRTIVEGRASAGASSPYAVERTDLAIASLASRLDEARADEQVASTELAAAVGIAGWHPRALGELADGELAGSTGVAKDHPGLAIDRAARAVALAEETRARGDAIPTPSVGLQAFATTEPSGVALSAGISLPLPLFDRNQGAVARARAQARRAELELAARGVELSTELDRAMGALVARRDALARFRTGALERLPRIRTMAEAAYRSGQGGIVELLDAIDAVTEARLRELELLRSVAESGLDVRAASRGR